jgi:flagellar FliJ protein
MKRFTFRLARLLELREAAERHQAGEMGRAVHEEAASARRAEQSADRLESARDQVTNSGETTAAGLLGAYRMAVEAASAQVEADAQALKVASDNRNREAERFTAARQDRQVLERIRERRHAAWGVDAARAEQGATDEVAQRQSAGKEGL